MNAMLWSSFGRYVLIAHEVVIPESRMRLDNASAKF